MKTKYRATIKMEDGRMLPIFPGRKLCTFPSLEKAIRRMERTRIAGRGYVWPAGKTLADTPISDVYTIAL